MSRRSLNTALLLLATLLSMAVARAETEHWVSVGSYQTTETAERGRQLVSEDVQEPLRVMGFYTDKGYYYRVVAGPYTRREEADRVRDAARAAGVSAAWAWTGNGGTTATTGSADSNDTLAPLDDDLNLDDLDYDVPLDLDADYYEELPPVGEEEGIRERDPLPELIEEAPENFKLNKLRRDAAVWPPPAETDSATNVSPVAAPAPVTLQLGNPISLTQYKHKELNIQIDGQLDEPQWRQMNGVSSFKVVDPDTLETPRYKTVVKMFYTEVGLYASFEMEQPRDTLVQRYSGRDEGRLNRDNVGVTLDTSGEGRYGYWLNLALGGNQVDGTVLAERQFSRDWDGAWYGATAITDKGWNAEIFLPWSQMAMPKAPGERRINAYASRKVASLDERWTVPALPFTQPLFMSALQPLELEQVDPRQQWSVFPYASVTQDEVEDFTETRLGADVFWRPSSNFQMTAALKPDFGNVESDDVIVNLGAFEVFFPEKRLFFKEGIEVFNTSPRAEGRDPLVVLNTRRIGGQAREPDLPDGVEVSDRELGQPIELIGAVKAVGQFGNVRYGLMGAVEDEAKFDVGPINYYQDGSDYGIARFLYEDKGAAGDYRAIGMISTMAAHPDADAMVQGLDYHYQTASGALKIDGQFLHSDTDEDGTGSGGILDFVYNPRQGTRLGLGLTHFDDGLNINDLGFQRRNDISDINGTLNINRSNVTIGGVNFRKFEFGSFFRYEENGDGAQTRKGIGSDIELGFPNRDELEVAFAFFPARDEDRDSRGNGTFEYENRTRASIEYDSDSSKRLSYAVDLSREDEALGGETVGARLRVTWRPVDRVNVNAVAEYRDRDGWLLWQGDRDFSTFAAREWRPRLNLDYFLSAKQQLRLSAQWVGIKAQEQAQFEVPLDEGALDPVAGPVGENDFAISRVNLQLRYRWEIAPLSELFVVYTLNGDYNDAIQPFDELFQTAYDDPIGEQLVVKLRYRLGT